jgi:hypothetical protein
LQTAQETLPINDSQRTTHQITGEASENGCFSCDSQSRCAGDKGFPSSVQDLVRDNPDKGAAHEGTTLARAE